MPAQLFDENARDYDAVLVVSFGGPEGPDDVMPFLDNVLAGLSVPPVVKARIAERYQQFGGVSPINAHTRSFIAALESALTEAGLSLPVYWGNRNWHPLLPDTLAAMARDGVSRAIAFATSTFSSYSGCRRYREDLYRAAAGVAQPPVIDKLRSGFNHPGFINAVADRVAEQLDLLPEARRIQAPLLFTAHSLPESMARGCRYQLQLIESCRLVAESLGLDNWRLVYQSNNASYGEPWLEPDIADALRTVRDDGATDAIVMPIGFVCDHMEVVLDLDVDARAVADEIGLNMWRAGTVGSHPAYVGMVVDLIRERMQAAPERAALGSMGPGHDYCPPDCCLSGRPGPVKPALCGAELRP